MNTIRARILMGLGLILSTFNGCGCLSNNQVIVRERQGSPVHVDTSDGVKVKAPFVDVQVPPSRSTRAGKVDVPIFEPD